MKYAGFWRRVIATMIDSILWNAIWFFILATLATPIIYYDPSITIYDTVWTSLGVLTFWLYFAIMESSKYQGTLGKVALGIKVVDIDGNRISFAKATGRHFCKLISTLTFMIGYLMAAFTKKKQALHDIIVGCLVVKK